MILELIASIGAALSGTAVAADVIVGPMTGYRGVEEIGAIEFGTTYRTPDGVPYSRELGPEYGITGHSVHWSPVNMPVMVELARDHEGTYLLLTSLLTDQGNRNLCWRQEPISNETAASKRALSRHVTRSFVRWSAECSVTRTLGDEAVVASFSSIRQDFERALKRFMTARSTRYLDDERDYGVPSFLPTQVSQPLLNAIASACGGPPSRIQLQQSGRIDFDYNPRLPYGADGTRPFDSCVNDQLRYVPGYKTVY